MAVRIRVLSKYCRFLRTDTEFLSTVTGTFEKHPAACGMRGDCEGEARWRAETSRVFWIMNYRYFWVSGNADKFKNLMKQEEFQKPVMNWRPGRGLETPLLSAFWFGHRKGPWKVRYEFRLKAGWPLSVSLDSQCWKPERTHHGRLDECVSEKKQRQSSRYGRALGRFLKGKGYQLVLISGKSRE